MKKAIFIAVWMIAFATIAALPMYAQETPTGPTNSVQITYVACADAGVINLSGTMLTGWDVYYQLFDNANGAGNALSSLRQVSVDGTYAVSERLPYISGGTVAAGGTGSARVLIAREGNSSSVDFETTVNDLQDGCSTPVNAPATSLDTGTGAPSADSAGAPVRILAPGSGFVNPNLEPESDVFLGARPSLQFRSETPGLIFAECDSYQLALPGIIYDTDSVTIFWSWFTRTRAQMDQHLATADYSVRLNNAVLTTVQRSEPARRGGANTWVFYTATVGNLRPGHYEVEYKVEWTEPHFDGYDNYGPGTETPLISTRCNFDVLPNTTGASVSYNLQYFPTTYPVHDLLPGQ